MLNKPPPIPFNLPKEASLAPRNVKDDPMNDPPHVALFKLEGEAKNLKEEVAALKWLAKRKEQEWNRYGCCNLDMPIYVAKISFFVKTLSL